MATASTPAFAQDLGRVAEMLTDSNFTSGFASLINPKMLASWAEIMMNPALMEAMMGVMSPDMVMKIMTSMMGMMGGPGDIGSLIPGSGN